MLTFPRSAASRLRVFARKCQPGRTRGPAPAVWILSATHGHKMLIATDECSVALRIEARDRLDAPLSISMKALDNVEGPGDDLVQVEPQTDAVTLHWTERGLPRSECFAVPAGSEPPRLPMPKTLTPVPVRFLTALYEAGRSAAREPMRYALHRVQIRGEAGEVIGTDSRFVARFEGFTLLFTEEILAPAVPLFGLRDWSKAGDIRIGRTAKCLVVVTDDVTVWLRLDHEGRYPDVAKVVPRQVKPTQVTFDPTEALFLLDRLSELPSQNDPHQPITLDLSEGCGAVIRAAGEVAKEIVEIQLPRSTVKSGSQRLALELRYLVRLLSLGCRSLRVVSDQKPVVADGDSITTLIMPVESDLIIPPSATARVLIPDTLSETFTTRRKNMKIAEPSTNGNTEGEALDPLVEAEALRNALSETLQRLGRLVTALRCRKKEQKALNQVWSSLKNLQLGD